MSTRSDLESIAFIGTSPTGRRFSMVLAVQTLVVHYSSSISIQLLLKTERDTGTLLARFLVRDVWNVSRAVAYTIEICS